MIIYIAPWSNDPPRASAPSATCVFHGQWHYCRNTGSPLFIREKRRISQRQTSFGTVRRDNSLGVCPVNAAVYAAQGTPEKNLLAGTVCTHVGTTEDLDINVGNKPANDH